MHYASNKPGRLPPIIATLVHLSLDAHATIMDECFVNHYNHHFIRASPRIFIDPVKA